MYERLLLYLNNCKNDIELLKLGVIGLSDWSNMVQAYDLQGIKFEVVHDLDIDWIRLAYTEYFEHVDGLPGDPIIYPEFFR